MLADIDSITRTGFWAIVSALVALHVVVLAVAGLHARAIVDLWREERTIRRLERELGRR